MAQRFPPGTPAAARPIERPLTESARRALPYIRSMVEQGLSSTAIQRTLSEAGMGVRRTDLLEAIRRVKGTTLDVRRYLQGLGDRTPDPARIPTALTAQTRRYAVIVRVEGVDPITGEARSQPITVSLSQLRPPSEIIERTAELLTQGEYGLEPEAFEIVGASYDPSAPLF